MPGLHRGAGDRHRGAGGGLPGPAAQPPARDRADAPGRRWSLSVTIVFPRLRLVAADGRPSTRSRRAQLAWATDLGRSTWEHVKLTLVSRCSWPGAVPLGIPLTRGCAAGGRPLFVGIGNIGQAAPAIGLVVLLAIWLGFGFWTAVLALALYGVLPVLRNTIAGLQGVDRTLVEAGRGVGMSAPGRALRIESPLALPVIMAGVRTALVLPVGTATLVTFINAGGLGAIPADRHPAFRFSLMIAGARPGPCSLRCSSSGSGSNTSN